MTSIHKKKERKIKNQMGCKTLISPQDQSQRLHCEQQVGWFPLFLQQYCIMHNKSNFVLANHDNSLNKCWYKESNTVDDGQTFRTDCVHDLKLSLLSGLEEYIDTFFCDHQECGYESLRN